MRNIFLVGEKYIFLTNLAVLVLDNVFQRVCNLQHVSNIIIHFGRNFFKISPNFCVWLDMVTIGHCPLQQCTWLPFPSCQAMSSSSCLGQSGQPILGCSCGRAWAVDLRLEEAPEAEVERGARSIPYSRKVIPNSSDNLIVFKCIQRNNKIVNTHYQGFFFNRLIASHGFVKNSKWISYQLEFYLALLILIKLSF